MRYVTYTECPACGQKLDENYKTCPECGLFLR
ncbi:MAG: zinc-ribbon domain-containing protein [Bacteroidales bacterium]|nr:zinc-ribbon domain-containing protein [Bacteroidales bacterium]